MMECALSIAGAEPSQKGEHVEDPLKGLREYHRLLEKSQRVSYLLEKTEECRNMVPPGIHQSVREDYKKRKREIDKVVEQERQACIAVYQEKFSEKEKVQGSYQQLSDRLKELKFRYLLGEYGEEEIEEECNNLRRQLMEYVQRLSWLEEVLNLYVHTFGLDNLISEKDARETAAPSPTEEEPLGERGENAAAFLSSMPPVEVGAGNTQSGQISEPIGKADALAADGSAGSTSAEQKPQASYARGSLILLEGNRKGERFPLISGDITLGSASGNDFVLGELGVAKSHARVLYKDRKFVLENQDILGRTYVNGMQAKSAELNDGDVISLGEVKMRVELARDS